MVFPLVARRRGRAPGRRASGPALVFFYIESPTSSRRRRPEQNILIVQTNIATLYELLGRAEALRMRRDVYSRTVRLHGEESEYTLAEAFNFAATLFDLKRHREVKALMRKMIPVARRVLGENNGITLRMRSCYANALYRDDAATLDDLYEAVTTLEETDRIARRVLGSAHPLVRSTEFGLRQAFARFKAFGEALKEH